MGGRSMGFDLGNSDFGWPKESPIGTTCFPRKFRWLMRIGDVASEGTNVLPPSKSARPKFNFKEMEIQHLNETIYFPQKPDWQPVNLTLYSIAFKNDSVFDWISLVYDSCNGDWNPATGSPLILSQFKKDATLELYDGCGNVLESWTYENAYPQTIDWGDLDMSNSEVCTVDVSLRFDRAVRNPCD